MGRNKSNDYFGLFVELAEYACKAAQILDRKLRVFDYHILSDAIEEMHAIEHAADMKKHELMKRLAHEFITPIEREDIVLLAQEIDDVTDAVEDILRFAYMYNLRSMRSEATAFTELIVKSCETLKLVMQEFSNFRKSKTIHSNIVEINYLEETGDRMYAQAMRTLFTTSKDPVELMSWSKMYDHFEGCLDACEDAADIVESVIMKNS